MSPLKSDGRLQLVSVTDEKTGRRVPVDGLRLTPDRAPNYLQLTDSTALVWFAGRPVARVFRFSRDKDDVRSWVWRCAALSCLDPPADHPAAGYQIGDQTWAEAVAALDHHIRTRHAHHLRPAGERRA